jgi:hypothetical protein
MHMTHLHRANLLMWCMVVLYVAIAFARLGHMGMAPAYGDDNAVYITSAIALATGQGYKLIALVGSPPALFYPIGYPMALAPFFAIFSVPVAMLAGRLLNIALVAAASFLVYGYLTKRTQVSPVLSALVVGMFALCPTMFTWTLMLYSESLYTCLSILCLLAAGKESRKICLITGVLAGLSMLVRTLGFTLVGALLLSSLLKRNWRQFWWQLFGVAAIQGPWLLYSFLNKGGTLSGYSGQAAREWSLASMAHNVMQMVSVVVPTVVVPITESQVFERLLDRLPLFTFGLAAIGCLVWWMVACRVWQGLKAKAPMALYICLYVGLLIVWPWPPPRFMTSVFPILAIFLSEHLHESLLRWHPRAGKILGAIAIVAILSSLSLQVSRVKYSFQLGDSSSVAGQAAWDEFQESAALVENNTEKDAVIVSSWPYSLWLLTNRKTVWLSPTTTLPQTFEKTGKDHPVYVLASRRDHPNTGIEFGVTPVLNYIKEHPQDLYEAGRTARGTHILYRVSK